MKNKIIAASGLIAGLFGLVATKASAAALFTVRTSTVTSFTASVTDTLADTGTLQVIVAVLALPALFWVIHRLKGLFPKGR